MITDRKRAAEERKKAKTAERNAVAQAKALQSARLKELWPKHFRYASDLADAAGIHRQTLEGYLKGTRLMDDLTSTKIAALLCVDPAYLRPLDSRIGINTYTHIGKTNAPVTKPLRLSLFLSTDIEYFLRIVKGQYVVGPKMTEIHNPEALFGAEWPPHMHAVKNPNDAMMPRYAAGAPLLVDPDAICRSGMVVQAYISAMHDTVIRVLVEEQQADGSFKKILRALNSGNSFPDIEFRADRGDEFIGSVWRGIVLV